MPLLGGEQAVEKSGLNLDQCLLGSVTGWLIALAISGVFHRLRRVAPRPTAFPGMGIACLWLVCKFVFLLIAASDRDASWLSAVLVTFPPLLGCAALAWWHRATLGMSRATAFGILVVEFVVALIVWGALFKFCQLLCLYCLAVFGAEINAHSLYPSVLPVLLLSLLVEEIVGPVRRRARRESMP